MTVGGPEGVYQTYETPISFQLMYPLCELSTRQTYPAPNSFA